ncbi:SGNH/GDSL hydrolase family protein [Massilia sp. BJB1822]|uniref:SGNH/GDSL hydrolase family protein n=1 Tax=Massilia sp. BJB1822 TaxID=2744470 RepID=UPI00159391E2|nr:SGNH/GDSL hydrolase family protein [Massilia sp. BJB1822]NVD99770.1 esterase [Massilia sp. BJB1822]
MRTTKLALAAMAAAALAACGGSSPSPGEQNNKVQFASQVSFGDSLSDIGTYRVGTVKAIGGGTFTINGDNTGVNPALTGKNWTELMAAQLKLPAPCPAMTGLDGDASKGFSVPIATNSNCFSYAQGGSRVTNPIGKGHKATGSALGALTVPVVQQVKNHLAVTGGKFSGKELVLIMTGGNDLLVGLGQLDEGAKAAGAAAGAKTFGASLTAQLAAGAPNPATAAQAIGAALAAESVRPGHTDASVVTAAVTAAVTAGNTAVASPAVSGPMALKAKADGAAAGAQAGADYVTATSPTLVTAMATAANELVALVKTQVVGNGANYVVVNNIPDVANTPAGLAKSATIQTLINAMVKAFNDQLNAGLSSESKVLVVDVFAVSHDQATNPGPYGLTNVKDTACDTSKNPLGNSLGCNASNLIAGDVSHYSYADDVHPTPFNYFLLARYVSQKMTVKGWL